MADHDASVRDVERLVAVVEGGGGAGPAAPALLAAAAVPAHCHAHHSVTLTHWTGQRSVWLRGLAIQRTVIFVRRKLHSTYNCQQIYLYHSPFQIWTNLGLIEVSWRRRLISWELSQDWCLGIVHW